MMNDFLFDYSKILAAIGEDDYSDNFDPESLGFEYHSPNTLKSTVKVCLQRLGIRIGRNRTVPQTPDNNYMLKGLEFARPHLEQLSWIYSRLGDDESRELLVLLTAYRAVGYRKIKLPLSNPDYWSLRRRIASLPHESEEIDVNFHGWKLHRRDLRALGYPIDVFSSKYAFMETFVQQQYRCLIANGSIECNVGDVVIDAGGCYGDTALYFAEKTGPTGKVAVFEFLPDNLKILYRNLDLNPDLKQRIQVLERPVWSESNQELFIHGNGPATVVSSVARPDNSGSVRTMRIDEIVETKKLDRVDFIKMDIEGAEPEALKGAEAVIKQFSPKLAITVYHSFSHFWELPRLIHRFNSDYKFYLRHFTIHAGETVLFAALE
jgi:FkbM family methyltransferase